MNSEFVTTVIDGSAGLGEAVDQDAAQPNTTGPDSEALEGRQTEFHRSQDEILRGGWYASGEYATFDGRGTFDLNPGQSTYEELVDQMEDAGMNSLRLPFNSHNVLGLDDNDGDGEQYKEDLRRMVDEVTSRGMRANLDLHWSAPEGLQAGAQQGGMIQGIDDKAWREVATMFKDNPLVIFELHNEPFGEPRTNEQGQTVGFEGGVPLSCWLDGSDEECEIDVANVREQKGDVSDFEAAQWDVVGVNEVIAVIRDTGALNEVMVSGVAYANDTGPLIENFPQINDPADNITAAFHVYPFNACSTPECFDQEVAPLLELYPHVTITEFGITEGENPEWVAATIAWAEDNGVGWQATSAHVPVHGIFDSEGNPTVNGRPVLEALAGHRPEGAEPLPNTTTTDTVEQDPEQDTSDCYVEAVVTEEGDEIIATAHNHPSGQVEWTVTSSLDEEPGIDPWQGEVYTWGGGWLAEQGLELEWIEFEATGCEPDEVLNYTGK